MCDLIELSTKNKLHDWDRGAWVLLDFEKISLSKFDVGGHGFWITGAKGMFTVVKQK